MKPKPNNTQLFPVSDQPLDRSSLHSEILDTMEQGIVVWNADYVCELVSRRYFDIMQMNERDLHVGMPIEEFYKRLIKHNRMTQEEANAALSGFKNREVFSTQRRTPDGNHVSLYARPLASGGSVVTFTDITDLHNISEEKNRALKRAEQAERKMSEALILEQAQKTQANQLAEFGDWLQSCKSLSELYLVVKQALQAMYPWTSGQLYIYSNSRDTLDLAVNWGEKSCVQAVHPSDCWSLRRGRAYSFGSGLINLPCNHVSESSDIENKVDQSEESSTSTSEAQSYLCLPIIAHGDTVGLLHIDSSGNHGSAPQDLQSANQIVFMTRCAEQISLAVANVRLRAELHEQSTLDPLTGMYNRRSYITTVNTEIYKLNRDKAVGAMIMFDIDNFKNFNDRFGHEAGDTVLTTVSELAHSTFGENNLTARIGGEEFSVFMPDCTVQKATQMMIAFLKTVSQKQVAYGNQVLPAVTLSAGICGLPHHANDFHGLLKIADQAMYQAKHDGRNRVVVASDSIIA